MLPLNFFCTGTFANLIRRATESFPHLFLHADDVFANCQHLKRTWSWQYYIKGDENGPSVEWVSERPDIVVNGRSGMLLHFFKWCKRRLWNLSTSNNAKNSKKNNRIDHMWILLDPHLRCVLQWNQCLQKGSIFWIINNYWMRLSIIWRIMEIEEGVICRGHKSQVDNSCPYFLFNYMEILYLNTALEGSSVWNV